MNKLLNTGEVQYEVESGLELYRYIILGRKCIYFLTYFLIQIGFGNLFARRWENSKIIRDLKRRNLIEN